MHSIVLLRRAELSGKLRQVIAQRGEREFDRLERSGVLLFLEWLHARCDLALKPVNPRSQLGPADRE